MTYRIGLESIEDTYPELESLYRTHYGEMVSRLAEQGISLPAYAPRTDRYFAAGKAGHLLTFVARTETGEPVGYSNIWLTNDMHNGDLIAQEDTIYVLPAHRNGLGRLLAKAVLSTLRERGVRRLNVTAATDPRATKLWERMGFRHAATAMTYIF